VEEVNLPKFKSTLAFCEKLDSRDQTQKKRAGGNRRRQQKGSTFEKRRLHEFIRTP